MSVTFGVVNYLLKQEVTGENMLCQMLYILNTYKKVLYLKPFQKPFQISKYCIFCPKYKNV